MTTPGVIVGHLWTGVREDKVCALADRGAVRDLIDVQAASRHRATADLESLGRRRAHDEFGLEDLQAG
ncbi:hypothetical protein [Streptomyces sp. SAI-229]|jgi:hypothetical protein|uniref:hypothetical protein n=1 Tax=Streptomyces sp. SAI-229 TaxID=3377731 RepID=UPI003C7BAA99